MDDRQACWLVGTKGGLLKGNLDGNWEKVGDYNFRMTSIVRSAERVVVGVGSGLWEVDMSGGMWKQLHDETLTEVLAVDAIPGDPGIVAASAYGIATGERDEMGAVRWNFWSDDLLINERFSNAVLVIDNERWLVGTEGGILVAEDGGKNWTHTSLSGTPVRGLCRALGSFWVGTDERGIWRSEDGVNWRQAGRGLDQGTVFSLTESGGRIVAGSLEGIVVGDGEGNWQRLGPRMLMAAVAADPADDSVWLAGGDPGGLWITRDAGETWQQMGVPATIEAILAPEGD